MARDGLAATVAAILLLAVTWAVAAETPAGTLAPRPLERIEPGTVIADRAPPGWSELMIKSVPKVTSGDVDDVSESTIKLASLFFNAILVKAGPHEVDGRRRFQLERLAIGLGTRVDGKDTILSYSDPSYRQLGAGLGWIAGKVLAGSEQHLNDIVIVARSPTMAIFDSPCHLLRNGQHVPALVRYACLVDPRDGRIYTLAWLLDKTELGYRLADNSLVLMPPNLVADCDLHVDASKFLLGIPGDDAFAVTGLPPGKQLPMPDAVRPLAADGSFTQASAHRIEVGLWTVIFPPAVRQASSALTGPRP